jgi:hypothetical protein
MGSPLARDFAAMLATREIHLRARKFHVAPILVFVSECCDDVLHPSRDKGFSFTASTGFIRPRSMLEMEVFVLIAVASARRVVLKLFTRPAVTTSPVLNLILNLPKELERLRLLLGFCSLDESQRQHKPVPENTNRRAAQEKGERRNRMIAAVTSLGSSPSEAAAH